MNLLAIYRGISSKYLLRVTQSVLKLKGIFHNSRFARTGGANDFYLVKNQPRKLNLVQLLSVSVHAQEDRKRSDSTTIAKVETCSLRPRG
jgi:hypothetical protein